MDQNNYVERLRAERKQLNLTQEQLAKHLDVSLIIVRNWEQGVTAIPPFLFTALKGVAGAAVKVTTWHVGAIDVTAGKIERHGPYATVDAAGNAMNDLYPYKKWVVDGASKTIWVVL